MLKVGFKNLLAQANSMIGTVSVQDLETHVDHLGGIIVDVKETSEWEEEDSIPRAIHTSRGLLEFHVDPASEMHISALKSDQQTILYCGTGVRSALAAKKNGRDGIYRCQKFGRGLRSLVRGQESRIASPVCLNRESHMVPLIYAGYHVLHLRILMQS